VAPKGVLDGNSRQENRGKCVKNDAMFTTCTLGGSCIVLIMNGLFFQCTIIGAIDREGDGGKGNWLEK
jgi:hypothetical protein